MKMLKADRLVLASRTKQKVYRNIQRFPFLPTARQYNITVCHRRRFFWFRVAKVGTRTILKHFVDDENPTSIETTSSVYYSPELFKDYYKFAFVRNPWDRLISCWLHRVVRLNAFGFSEAEHERMQSLENFIDYVQELDIEECDCHLRAQSSLINLSDVDYIGRMESFGDDLMHVSQQIGSVHKEIVHKNATPNRKTYQTYYNDILTEKVSEIYRKDIQIFGYRF